MNKTVCELFAGVGGFRCGLNHIKNLDDVYKPEKWNTVWFNQWEPLDKSTQWAYSCYVNRFGNCLDLNGDNTSNIDINAVDKSSIPDHNLLVGGFPCQDYSVAGSLSTSKGIEGKKGVLWWDIRDTLEAKATPFVLLENVDRLIKSPAKQRGRDFGIILACLRDLEYTVEWRVINAAEYGYQQRRRRTFIFAYKNTTNYASQFFDKNSADTEKDTTENITNILLHNGFFAKTFPITSCGNLKQISLKENIGDISQSFEFLFENTGIMKDGVIYSMKTSPEYDGDVITLGDVMECGKVDEKYFIPENLLYYTDPSINHSDEMEERLSKEQRHTWQYLKGGKRFPRKSSTGFEYVYSEGPISFLDEYDKPARTMLTSEGSFSRSTHIVKDKVTGKIRLLTPVETEHIQGFPSNWTRDCLVNEKNIEMPLNKRRFMMGNALVVNLISQMEPQLSEIFEEEL